MKKVLILCICVLVFGIFLLASLNLNAAVENYKFDFGNSGVKSGYIGVNASKAYNSSDGYGFNTPQNMKDVSASGSGVESDAVQFLTFGIKSNNTFNVDLQNGLYEVKVVLGNISRASVSAEGVYQIINLTGNNAKDTFQIPITDGQLNILVTEGKSGTAFTLSSLEINRLSSNTATNKTIYIGGDSTVCNYYPLDTSIQAGWGQMLSNYVDLDKYQVRNMSSGGQFARGFKDDGQFEAIMKYLKRGDYFILQFGINDTAEKNATTEAEFKEIMREMVVKAKSTGAEIVLSTPQGRATDFNSENVHTSINRWYRNSTVALANEENVVLVDLNVLSSVYFTSIGQFATLNLYMSGDTLHPNRYGANELARIFSEDLKNRGYLNEIVAETITPTVETEVSSYEPTNLADDELVAEYEITNDWGMGANCSVTLFNKTSRNISGWSIRWTFTGNQQITNLWNGQYTQIGSDVTVSNMSWNEMIQANGNISFGFGISYSGVNEIPTNIIVE
ncbi:MAG: cellulose binding domain-containing protein [Clostridiales bacterium]